MRELHLSPGDVARVAVEADDKGARVLLRLGNGRYRSISPARARLLAQLLITGAIEADELNKPVRTDEHPAPTRQPVAARPSRVDVAHHQV